MKKLTTFLFTGLLAGSMLVFVACDDEPTQDEANEAFCDSTAEVIASLRVIRDLDRDSTIDEIEEARERLRDAYANMLESRADLVNVRLDELDSAYQDLQQAVDDIEGDSTIEDALDAVDDELENVALEASQVLNDVSCNGAGSDSQSDE